MQEPPPLLNYTNKVHYNKLFDAKKIEELYNEYKKLKEQMYFVNDNFSKNGNIESLTNRELINSNDSKKSSENEDLNNIEDNNEENCDK